MIIDCEPVTFEYGGKKWMIEIWKGQYDFTTGCEIGVYTSGRDVKIPGFSGTFYDCAADEDMLNMAFSLRKNGELLFERHGHHWWLTGFLLGVFSQPWELEMTAVVTLKDRRMADAFSGGLNRIGYSNFAQTGNTVSFDYNTPRTPQPLTRTPHVETVTQWKNKFFCDRYRQITDVYPTVEEKLTAMREQSPQMFDILIGFGRKRDAFASYDAIREAVP
jgi:hypothetical protein